jgi:[acyl-carrier-protein] S-malonyltransferase
VPVVHNADVGVHPEPDAIRTALSRQAASPVRWVETIQAFAARGVTHVVECGPGRALTGMCKRIDRNLKGLALDAGADIEAVRAALAR